MRDKSRWLMCFQLEFEPLEIKQQRAGTPQELGKAFAAPDNNNLTLTQQRRAGCALLHPSPAALSMRISVQTLGALPASTWAILVCQGCPFLWYIALTRMLASSSSSHSLGSFPSFSRVGCKEHGHVKLMTEPKWTLHCVALGQSRAALICKLCFLPGPYFYFWSFNPFFLVKMLSLSLILVCVSPTCKCLPRASVPAASSNSTSSATRRFWGINQLLFHPYSPALCEPTSRAGFAEEIRKDTGWQCAEVEGRTQS